MAICLRQLPYWITQCYLTPDTGERDPPLKPVFFG